MTHGTAETVKTDGKRRISIAAASMPQEGFNVSVCRNGWQTTVVTLDQEMLMWLRDAITEHLGK